MSRNSNAFGGLVILLAVYGVLWAFLSGWLCPSNALMLAVVAIPVAAFVSTRIRPGR